MLRAEVYAHAMRASKNLLLRMHNFPCELFLWWTKPFPTLLVRALHVPLALLLFNFSLLCILQRNFSDSDDIFFDDPDGLELRSPSSSHSTTSGDASWDQRPHGSRSSSKKQWPASAVPRNVPLRFPVEGSGGGGASVTSSGVSPMPGGVNSKKKKGYAQVGGGAELESESSGDDEEGHEY